MACLCTGFFFAEMTIGPMWAIPMDIAPEHAGTASGMMNTGSALAAIISPVVSGFLIDRFGNWELPFLGSMGLMGDRDAAGPADAAGSVHGTPGLATLPIGTELGHPGTQQLDAYLSSKTQ